MIFNTVNPATGQIIKSYETWDKSRLDYEIEASHQAYLQWKQTSLDTRIQLMKQLIIQLEKERDDCARQISIEMGKPIVLALREIDRAIEAVHFFCHHGPEFLKDDFKKTEFYKSYVTYNPLGIVLVIKSWNYPYTQVLNSIIPSLLVGNVILLKHSSLVTGCALKIENLFLSAGFSKHIFKHLMISSKQIKDVISNPLVKGVNLTASTKTGKEIAMQAGTYLKKTVLELGGNDACIVLDDCDIKTSAETILSARLRNSGQVCVCPKRVIVEKSVHDALIKAFMKGISKYTMGDPLLPTTLLGPMASKQMLDKIDRQVKTLLSQGGKLIHGGYLPNSSGFYYPATLIDNVSEQSIVFEEEFFGPVLCVSVARDLKHAIELANQTAFGLGASIYTKNLELAEKIAKNDLNVGVCYINQPVSSDLRFPFGGINQSGYGRELSKEGMLEFSNIKTIIIHD